MCPVFSAVVGFHCGCVYAYSSTVQYSMYTQCIIYFYCTNLQTLLGFQQYRKSARQQIIVLTIGTVGQCVLVLLPLHHCHPAVPHLDELSLRRRSPSPPPSPPLLPSVPPVLPALLATVGGFAAHRLDTCDSSVTHHTPLQYVRHRWQRSLRRGRAQLGSEQKAC